MDNYIMKLRIIALAMTILQAQAQAMLKSVTSEHLIITRNSRFRPLVTKSSDRLIYASFPSYPRPKIKLETEQTSDLACELDFPTMDDTEYPLSFDSLANGKLVLSFVATKDLLYRYLLSLVIARDKCEFVAVMTTINETRNDNRELSRDSIVVLTGEDVFDVFFKRHQHCDENKACRLRYSENGELIGVTEFHIPVDAESWSISSVADQNFVDGFFYSVTNRNATVVQRLEQDLQVQQELAISKSFLYSASHGSVNNCRAISATNLECELRNVELTSRSRAVVEAEYFKSFMRAVRLFNLSNGSAMIVYILQVYVEPSSGNQFTTYLQHVDLHGHASNPIKFQEDLCKDFKDIGMIFMRDNFHCFNVYCRDSINTKCVTVGDM